MPYIVAQHPKLDVVELKLTGLITGVDLRKATSECIAIQKQNGIKRFLVDANEGEVVASFNELFEIVSEQYHIEGLDKNSRIAVMLPTTLSAKAAADFYEAVCLKGGWNALVFPSNESALDWLMDTADTSKSTDNGPLHRS